MKGCGSFGAGSIPVSGFLRPKYLSFLLEKRHWGRILMAERSVHTRQAVVQFNPPSPTLLFFMEYCFYLVPGRFHGPYFVFCVSVFRFKQMLTSYFSVMSLEKARILVEIFIGDWVQTLISHDPRYGF